MLAGLTVEVRTGRGGGAGVFWAERGMVITCSHVLGGDMADVALYGGREAAARVVARDNHADLALMAVGRAAGPPLELHVFTEEKPSQPAILVLKPELLKRIWSDFGPYFGGLKGGPNGG